MNHFAKIAEKLSAYELDGMLLTCEANRFYASGFHSTGTDGVALVTREGNFYFTDSRYIEAAHNKVQDAEIAMTDAAHPYVDLINAAMEKTHVQKLGFEDAYMTVADYRHYSEKLHCQLVPATELLISLRQSKDEEEIQRMIAAQRIAEAALDQIVKEIRPGVTEKEIAARLQYLMLAGGAENMSFDPIVASGPNGSMPHAVPTDRKIQDGDFVTMDFGCIYQGYCSDMTRTVAVGRVTEEMEKVYNVVLQAQLAGIAAAKAGAKVTLTATPDEGYAVGTITVTDRFGDAVKVTEQADGTYTFTMPNGQVTVKATFVETEEPAPAEPFPDVDENDWFYDEVVYVYENGLMNGVENNQFAPNTATNRAMLATILYRLAGEPAVSGDLPFTDVESGTWYTDAVLWAAQNGIVNGLGENTFAPMNTLTREQLVTMLYRYAQNKGYDMTASADLSGYPDADKIQSWAQEAMTWAVAEGIVEGMDGNLNPAGNATRAQIATILMRFCEGVAK